MSTQSPTPRSQASAGAKGTRRGRHIAAVVIRTAIHITYGCRKCRPYK